jgi:hypothetical protein
VSHENGETSSERCQFLNYGHSANAAAFVTLQEMSARLRSFMNRNETCPMSFVVGLRNMGPTSLKHR